jgi:hypothetical protein
MFKGDLNFQHPPIYHDRSNDNDYFNTHRVKPTLTPCKYKDLALATACKSPNINIMRASLDQKLEKCPPIKFFMN